MSTIIPGGQVKLQITVIFNLSLPPIPSRTVTSIGIITDSIDSFLRNALFLYAPTLRTIAAGLILPALALILPAENTLAPHASLFGIATAQTPKSTQPLKTDSSPVVSQGKLQPATGILKLSSIPGEKILKIHVAPGDVVPENAPLATLESSLLKQLELEIAELKLAESKSLHNANLRQAQSAIESAVSKRQTATLQKNQALAAQSALGKQSEILQSLKDQLHSLESLQENPRLRGAISSIEIETKRNQLLKAQSDFEQASLNAKQAVESADLALAQSELLTENAQASLEDLHQSTLFATLEKQIQLLQLQVDLAVLRAPTAGTILQVYVSPGERATTAPVFDFANLDEMVCVAEVHEADIAKIQIGHTAQLKSAALSKQLRGKVSRIDRVVGPPQMRSPNPLARSDFRSIPVWISIHPEDAPIAAERINLQVEVAISASDSSTPNPNQNTPK